MTIRAMFKPQEGYRSTRIHPLITLAVGVLLWYLPLLMFPLVGQPIASLLQMVGLLAPSAEASNVRFAVGMVMRWLAVIVLLAFVVWVERLPLRSLGIWKPQLGDVYWVAVFGWLGILAGIGLFLLVQGFRPGIETAADQIADRLSWLGRLQLIANAAIVEEVFFRGLLIERLIALTKSPWIAGVVSYVLFVASHIGGSGLTESLTIVALSSLVMTLIYLWRRNLVLCMVAHFVGNAPTLL